MSKNATSRTDIQIKFGEKIRKERTRLGLSQEELAAEAELDRTYMSGIERGTRNVSLINIQKIAKALKLSLSELFSL